MSTIAFIVLLLIAPGALVGLIRKMKARLQNRVGAPIWQPIFDTLKLFCKDETLSHTASWLFRFTAAFNVAAAVYLAVVVPWFAPKPFFGNADLFMFLYLIGAMRFFSLLAAMDTGSPFGAFAASREATLSFLVEPAAILSLASLAVAAGSSDLNVIFGNGALRQSHPALWLLSATALLLASLVELSRMPVDDPTTHLELTMVHEAMILEASGKNLALTEFSNSLKLLIFFGLSAQCYLHAIPAVANLSQFQSCLASATALCLVAISVAVFEASAVKLNWRKAPEFIAYALTLAFVASIIAVGGKYHMNTAPVELSSLLVALTAILMVGSSHIRLNIWMFRLQTMLLALVTALYAVQRSDQELYGIACALFVLKAVGVPKFLLFIVRKVDVQTDSGNLVPTPIAMHLSLAFLVISYILARQLPMPLAGTVGWPSATAAISLVCTGLLLMLTRRIALTQIVGFLVMENGIYLFGLSQTQGVPMLVEMGILLDVLAGVMISGLIAFRIKKNFEHIDVTMLADLKE